MVGIWTSIECESLPFCRVLFGYPRVTVLDRRGTPRATALRSRPGHRDAMILGPGPRPKRVVVRGAGSAAVVWISWGDVPYPGVRCAADPSLRIAMPATKARALVRVPNATICGRPVTEPVRGPRFISQA